MPRATIARRRLDVALTALGGLLAAALIITLALGGFSFSRHTGAGGAAEQARTLPPFTGVVLAGDNNVVVDIGARQSVVVHADRNLLRRVTTRVRSGRLVIGTTPGPLQTKSPMFVAVSVPALDAVELPGHGNISVTGLSASRFTADLPGDGTIEATGTARTLDVSIGGMGTALLHGLAARDATAELSGAGSIMVTATHSLAARLSGSGTILYGGDPPHLIKAVSGSGTIGPG
jgi:Putative auto-transporter adhesin, head GIN domain